LFLSLNFSYYFCDKTSHYVNLVIISWYSLHRASKYSLFAKGHRRLVHISSPNKSKTRRSNRNHTTLYVIWKCFFLCTTRRPASADRTARRQFQAGLSGDVGL